MYSVFFTLRGSAVLIRTSRCSETAPVLVMLVLFLYSPDEWKREKGFPVIEKRCQLFKWNTVMYETETSGYRF